MVTLIVALSIYLLLYFLNKASKKDKLEIANESYELRMNMLYQLIGIAGLLMSCVFLLMPILAGEYTTATFVVSGFMFLIFASLSATVLLWYKNHRIRFNDVRIISHNLFGKEQRMDWTDIKSAVFKPFTGVMALSDKDGNIVKVHYHLVGFSTFVRSMLVQKHKYGFNCENLPPTT